jgi:hypothetical protein
MFLRNVHELPRNIMKRISDVQIYNFAHLLANVFSGANTTSRKVSSLDVKYRLIERKT